MGSECNKMVKIGFLFAGQGAQSVGMGKSYYDTFPQAKAVFERASDVLGLDVAELCFQGPEEKLKQTVNTQIAIFTTSMAILESIKTRVPQISPAVCCGLSLGEYAALVASGVSSFQTTMEVVKKRGALMEEAANNNPGGMVSVIGLCEEVVEEIASQTDVDVANYNSPEQIVLSGKKDNIQKAHDMALEKGAKKAVVLNVGGAFHSRLMKEASDGMRQVLAAVEFKNPSTLFIPNVSAEPIADSDTIKQYLIDQVAQSVKWTQTINYCAKLGIQTFLEIGPGKVLKGLARRTDKSLNVIACENLDALDEISALVTE